MALHAATTSAGLSGQVRRQPQAEQGPTHQACTELVHPPSGCRGKAPEELARQVASYEETFNTPFMVGGMGGRAGTRQAGGQGRAGGQQFRALDCACCPVPRARRSVGGDWGRRRRAGAVRPCGQEAPHRRAGQKRTLSRGCARPGRSLCTPACPRPPPLRCPRHSLMACVSMPNRRRPSTATSMM